MELRKLFFFFGACLLGIGVWSIFGYATSFDEAIFLRRLSSKVSSGASEIRLPELMPGDWEVVCESHGYDGPLYLKSYNKTFDPVAPPQDGVWGLIFISNDGSFSSAVASCRTSKVKLNTNGCTERENAILIREAKPEQCAVFSVKDRLTHHSTGPARKAAQSGEFKRCAYEKNKNLRIPFLIICGFNKRIFLCFN